MLIDPPTQRNLLVDLCADGGLEDDLGHVCFDGDDSSSGCGGADVDQEDLACDKERGRMTAIRFDRARKREEIEQREERTNPW